MQSLQMASNRIRSAFRRFVTVVSVVVAVALVLASWPTQVRVPKAGLPAADSTKQVERIVRRPWSTELSQGIFGACLRRNDDTDGNTLLAAYTVLGGLDVRSVLPRIINELTRKTSQVSLSNRIAWLQGYKRSVQIGALKQIAAGAQNSGVHAEAQRRLRYLRTRKP